MLRVWTTKHLWWRNTLVNRNPKWRLPPSWILNKWFRSIILRPSVTKFRLECCEFDDNISMILEMLCNRKQTWRTPPSWIKKSDAKLLIFDQFSSNLDRLLGLRILPYFWCRKTYHDSNVNWRTFLHSFWTCNSSQVFDYRKRTLSKNCTLAVAEFLNFDSLTWDMRSFNKLHPNPLEKRQHSNENSSAASSYLLWPKVEKVIA